MSDLLHITLQTLARELGLDDSGSLRWADRFSDGYAWILWADDGDWTIGTDDHFMSECRADFTNRAFGPVTDPQEAASRALACVRVAKARNRVAKARNRVLW